MESKYDRKAVEWCIMSSESGLKPEFMKHVKQHIFSRSHLQVKDVSCEATVRRNKFSEMNECRRWH